MMDLVRETLEADGWVLQETELPHVLHALYQGETGRWQLYFDVRADIDVLMVVSVIPDEAPLERRAAIAELFNRANFGILVGNFELDLSDGEMRYRTSVDVEGTGLTPALLRRLVVMNVSQVDRWMTAIREVLLGGAAREAAAVVIGR